MKFNKTVNRYCRKCNKHTKMAISTAKKRERSSLSHGSIQRAHKRGLGIGMGNLGKWGSKPPISKWKMAGAKSSKKTDLRYKCSVCNKSWMQREGFRTKKVEFKQG
ncbi:MAG TPA: 50S ribosomal protein L44e [Candidatus Nanoarchaeia archaeon]|nr:50S ribosomal protein L44e [Candidatus Nanoarchaeia archaeon]